MSNEQGICFSTREFDTCQTKGCCSRVQDFRRRDMSKALRGFLICSLLKSERRIEDGVLDRAQPESLNFGLVWHGQIDHSGRLHYALRVESLFAVRAEGISQGLHHCRCSLVDHTFSVLKVPGTGIQGGVDILITPFWLHWL